MSSVAGDFDLNPVDKVSITFWGLGQLVQKVDQGELEVPLFQRSLVWSDEKRTNLVTSLLRRHPVGSILVARRSDNDKWQLVDGLQRSYAISQFTKQPLSFVKPDGALEPLVRQLRVALGGACDADIDADRLDDELGNWLSTTVALGAAAGFDASVLWSVLRGAVIEPSHEETALPVLRGFLDDVRTFLSIEGQNVPVIEFTGPDAELADIFEKLNSSGTPLSRYDILAARWVSTRVLLTDIKIREEIQAKYQDLEDKGFTVSAAVQDGVVVDSDSGSIDEAEYCTLYEYLFGLGRALTKEYPDLFKPLSEEHVVVPSVGFTIGAIAHGMRLFPDIGDLPSRFAILAGQPTVIDPRAFQEAVENGARQVSASLQPILGLQLNRRGAARGSDIVHTEYQIAAAICRFMVAGYDGDWMPRESPDEPELVRKALPSHYLRETLSGVWQGAGDSLLFRRVWFASSEEDQDTVNLERSVDYTKPISTPALEATLQTWFEDEQLTRLVRRRAPIRGTEKMFLRYVYAGIVTHAQDKAAKYEIEHLFPVARLSRLIPEDAGGWPIGAISNLALFPSKLNRAKRDQTVGEFLKSKGESDRADELAKISSFLLCDYEDISIPKKVRGRDTGGDDFDEEAFQAFLRKRFAGMVTAALSTIAEIES